jgi:hypothetical protein
VAYQASKSATQVLDADQISDSVPTSPIVWDSGGASFQITSRGPDAALRAYNGRLGTSIAYAALVAHRRAQADAVMRATINPVSRAEAEATVAALSAALPPLPPWLAGGPPLVCLMGINCLFRLVADVRGGRVHPIFDSAPLPSFTPADVEDALARVLDKSDADLVFLVDFPHADPVEVIVPKLCLLATMTRHLQPVRVSPVAAVGSCAGVLALPSFWTP